MWSQYALHYIPSGSWKSQVTQTQNFGEYVSHYLSNTANLAKALFSEWWGKKLVFRSTGFQTNWFLDQLVFRSSGCLPYPRLASDLRRFVRSPQRCCCEGACARDGPAGQPPWVLSPDHSLQCWERHQEWMPGVLKQPCGFVCKANHMFYYSSVVMFGWLLWTLDSFPWSLPAEQPDLHPCERIPQRWLPRFCRIHWSPLPSCGWEPGDKRWNGRNHRRLLQVDHHDRCFGDCPQPRSPTNIFMGMSQNRGSRHMF